MRFNAVVNAGGESSSRRFDRGPKRYLQTPGEKQHDQDKEDDPADSDSTTRSKGVITAAAAEQQSKIRINSRGDIGPPTKLLPVLVGAPP